MCTHTVICSAMKKEKLHFKYKILWCFMYSLFFSLKLSSKGLGVRLQVKDSCTFDYFKRKKYSLTFLSYKNKICLLLCF